MSQRILVTAGASGFGREIVRAFVANGAKVFVCDIDGKGLELLAQELPGLTTKICDVSKREDIERMVAFGVDALGGVDVLVNNAGISGPTAPVEEMNPDEWEKVMQGRPHRNIQCHALSHSSPEKVSSRRNHQHVFSCHAALAVFLASDAAKSISGQMLPIDNDMQQAS